MKIESPTCINISRGIPNFKENVCVIIFVLSFKTVANLSIY